MRYLIFGIFMTLYVWRNSETMVFRMDLEEDKMFLIIMFLDSSPLSQDDKDLYHLSDEDKHTGKSP